MKTLEDIKAQLELMKPTLRKRFQVETVGIFGSYCHERQKKRSDVDILVTFSEPNSIDLIDLVGLQQFLSRKLKTKVDLVEKDSLKAQIKNKILEETVYV